MDLTKNKNLFLIFLSIRFLTSLSMGFISSQDYALRIITYFFSLLFLISLFLIYKNNLIGTYIFSSIAIIELLLNIQNITNIEYLPSLLFWRVFGIYLAYKTYMEIREDKKTQIK